MSERLYFAFDWIVGRELLPVTRAFDLAVKYRIVISLIRPRWLPNGFWAYQIGVSVEDTQTLEYWLKDIGGDMNRLIPVNSEEFDQSFEIFSMDEEGRRSAYTFYKVAMLRLNPYRLNNVRDAMEIQRLLRKRLRGWHIYTMAWDVPLHFDLRNSFAQKANAVVKHMYQVVDQMGGTMARSLNWPYPQGEKKQRFYVILPSYEALSSFTQRALPTLPMCIWSEILPSELPNYLDRHRLRLGLYLPGLE